MGRGDRDAGGGRAGGGGGAGTASAPHPSATHRHQRAADLVRGAMNTSERLDQLIPALALARPHFGRIGRSKKNPHFNFDYAPLEDILEAVDAPLAAQGLVLMGAIDNTSTPGVVTITTRLVHSSEQWIECVI